MSDDDDLPVLTHVLRTAGGRMPPPLAGPFDDAFHDDFGIHPFDETPLAGRLVIGHEAHPGEPVADLAPPIEVHEQPIAAEIVADPRRSATDDAFRLVQDVDGAAATPAPIDEPEFASADGDRDGAMEFEASIVFATPPDDEALAARVREAVLVALAGRIDTELDARIAQAMHAEVESALARLQGDLRSHLTDALRDVVARAVDDELARIRRDATATGPH